MSSDIFLITGATGRTGGKVAALLLEGGHGVRAFVHKRDERSQQLERQGAQIYAGDLHDFKLIRSALAGVAGAYFVYPTQPGIVEATAIFAQAAQEAATPVIVNLSQLPARRATQSPASFNHWLAENVWRWSGLPVVNLKPTIFAETLLFYGQGVKDGLVLAPFGKGRHAPLASADIARLVASILESPPQHIGQSYPLFGLQEYTYAEAIARIGALLGRSVTYQQIPLEAAREQWLKWFTLFEAQHATAIVQDHDAGIFSGSDGVIGQITGRPPLSLDEFIQQHRQVFV